MKIMKQAVLASALAVGLTGVAAYAHDGDKSHRGRHRGEQMAERLKLTDDQKTQLKSIKEEKRQAMQGLRDQQGLSNEQKRQKAQELRQQFDTRIQGILTPEQQKEFTKMREEMKNKHDRHHRDGSDDNAPKQN